MPTIVTNPTAGDNHVNKPLTNFSQKWIQDQDMFVGLDVVPNNPVQHQSDLYYEFSRADFFRDEAEERADGTESAGSGFTLSTSPYTARVYAYHKDLTDRQRANQDSPVRLERSAMQFVMQKLMLLRERLMTSAYFGTSIWGTDVNVFTLPTSSWNSATGDPIVDIRTGKRVVHGLTGKRPNRLLIARDTYDAVLDNAQVLDRIIGGATTELPAMVMRQRLASLLELDQILVLDSVVNSAVRGATEATNFLASDGALLYYAPPSASLDEPTAGMQFSWTGYLGAQSAGQRIKRFRMEHLEADRIEGQMAFDYKVTAPELGYFFHSTLA